MVKSRKITIESIENEVTMAVRMTKPIITKIIIITMMRMRINIGSRIKI